SASPQVIINEDHIYDLLKKEKSAQFDQIVDQQRAEEIAILNSTDSFCPLAKLSDKTIRAEDIRKALTKGYGDASMLKALMCMNNSIVRTPQSAGYSRGNKIRSYLKNLKQIGGESVEGYAMLADV